MTELHELNAPALRTFFRLAEEWSLSADEQTILLGIPDQATLLQWRKGVIGEVDSRVLARIALLLGIYRALHTVFTDPTQANGWLVKAHGTGQLRGTSALAHMLKEGLPGMKYVHAHLAALLD